MLWSCFVSRILEFSREFCKTRFSCIPLGTRCPVGLNPQVLGEAMGGGGGLGLICSYFHKECSRNDLGRFSPNCGRVKSISKHQMSSPSYTKKKDDQQQSQKNTPPPTRSHPASTRPNPADLTQILTQASRCERAGITPPLHRAPHAFLMRHPKATPETEPPVGLFSHNSISLPLQTPPTPLPPPSPRIYRGRERPHRGFLVTSTHAC